MILFSFATIQIDVSQYTHMHQHSIESGSRRDSLFLPPSREMPPDVPLKLLQQKRDALLSPPLVSNGVFDLDLVHDGPVLEGQLDRVPDGALVGVHAVAGWGGGERRGQKWARVRAKEEKDRLVDRVLLVLLAVHLFSEGVDPGVGGDVVGAGRHIAGEKESVVLVSDKAVKV